MAFILNCFGCERELDTKTDQIYPQGKHQQYKLCKPCSKKWPVFEELLQGINDKTDAFRGKLIEEIRVKTFGNKDQAKSDEVKYDQPIIEKNKVVRKEA